MTLNSQTRSPLRADHARELSNIGKRAARYWVLAETVSIASSYDAAGHAAVATFQLGAISTSEDGGLRAGAHGSRQSERMLESCSLSDPRAESGLNKFIPSTARNQCSAHRTPVRVKLDHISRPFLGRPFE